MRGLTSTILLVLALAGLGAYIYFVDSKRPAPGVETRDKVFAVEADAIEEITLTAGGETTTVRKTEGTWRMTAPQAVDADQTEVSNLTSNLASLELNRVIDENASNLGEYGLAQPAIQISFKAANGVSGALNLGDKTATQADLYAAKPGESRVFVVSAFQESTFNKKPFDLRDKRVLHFERDKVDSLEIALGGGAPPMQFGRTGSDWVVRAPVQSRGEYSAIEGILTKLSTTNMTKLVEASATEPAVLAKYGLDQPAATITLGAGSTRATLALGREEDGAVYARDQSRAMVFAVDPSLLSDLKKPVEDYRDKDLFDFRGFNASRLRIVRGSETLEFQKVSAGEGAVDRWQRVGSGGATIDLNAAMMDDFLSKLTALRAQSFVTALDNTGLNPPALVVGVSYDQGKFERVRLGTMNGEAFASRDGESGAAKLDAQAYKDMAAALDTLLAPPPPADSTGNASPSGPSPANTSPIAPTGNASPGNSTPPAPAK
jgi:hypothetical protein